MDKISRLEQVIAISIQALYVLMSSIKADILFTLVTLSLLHITYRC